MFEVISHFPVIDKAGKVVKLYSTKSGALQYVNGTKGNRVGEYINQQTPYTKQSGEELIHGVNDNIQGK